MLSRKHRPQLFATVFANLTTFAYGIAIGWPSSNLPRLQTENTPLLSKIALNLDEASWVGSIYLIGGTVSSLFYGWTAEKYGRKITIILAALPQMLSWTIIEFGANVNHLYLARLLVGFGGGGCFVTIPMYVSEISSDKIRGALGAMIVVSCNFGILVGYTINSYLDYYTVPYIAMAIFIVFFIGFPFASESPKHLITQNHVEAAVASLKYFRGYEKEVGQYSNEFQEELKALISYRQPGDTSRKSKLTMNDFTCKSARKAIFIGIFLNFLCIVNGIVAITNYSETIFNEAGSTLSSEMSTIVIGTILLIGSYTSSILIDKAGRKVLMTISSTGCGLSLAVLGIFSHLKEEGHTFEGFTWIPLACLSSFMLLGSIGILSLQFVIMSEVLSQKIRGVISTVCLMENWFLAFITVKFFPLMLEVIGMHGCMLIFSLTCFSGVLFVFFVLPETKGKPIEAIIRELEMK